MDNLQITICAMATQSSDQPLVRQLAEQHPNVIPAFGQASTVDMLAS